MNKTAIIIGGVTLVGVVAYFYFKPKLNKYKEKIDIYNIYI